MTLPQAPLVSVAPRRNAKRLVSQWRTTKGCVIYARVSTGEKKGSRSRQISIEDQIRICRAKAEAMGFTVVKIYQDRRSRGVRRKDLVAMLNELPDMPDVGALFIWADTRLWGHQEQQRFLLYRLRRAGVRTFDSHGKEWKDDTPIDKLMNMFSAGLSEYETSMTAQRIYELYTGRAEDGDLLTRPTYGVKVVKKFEGERVVSEWTVDDDVEMPVIRRMFRDYASGLPTYQIAKYLRDENVPTQRGTGTWSPSTVRRYLDNPFYVGTLVWNRTKTEWEIDQETGDKIKRVAHRRDDEHILAPSPLGCILAEDINDPDSVTAAIRLWETCQARREVTGREREARKYPPRVLDGLLRCGRCNKHLMQPRRVGQTSKVTGERLMRFDYRCPGIRNTGTGCTRSHTMMEGKIQKLLTAWIRDLMAGAENKLVEWKEPQANASEIRAAERLVEAKKRAVTRVNEAYEAGDGTYTRDMFRERLAVVTDELQRANEALAKLLSTSDRPRQALSGERLHGIACLIDEIFNEAGDLDARRREAFGLFAEIRVDNPRLVITLR